MKVNFATYQPYFKGKLKKNLREGEEVLCEYKKEVPFIKSNTLWQQRLERLQNKDMKVKNAREIRDIISKYFKGVYDNRSNTNNLATLFYTKKRYVKAIKENIQKNKCANCGEVVDIISEKLDAKGIEHKHIGFLASSKMGPSDHVFILIGADKNADPTRPNTWGNGAVIIDGWRNFVLSVPDAIRNYEDLFCVNYNKTKPSGFKFRERCLR